MIIEFIIKMEDGAPVDHPMLVQNFIDCFPTIDIHKLPSNYAYFTKVERPSLSWRDIMESDTPVYEVQSDGTVKEKWLVRQLTLEEQTNKLNIARADKHPEGWVFNEESCQYEPTPEIIAALIASAQSNQ